MIVQGQMLSYEDFPTPTGQHVVYYQNWGESLPWQQLPFYSSRSHDSRKKPQVMYLLLCNPKKLLEKTENLHRQIITASCYNLVYVCSHSLQHWDRISITSPVWISGLTLNIITVLILNFRLSTYISLSLHANVQWGWGWEKSSPAPHTKE